MHFNVNCSLSHKNWRKLVKKARRKILRKKKAQNRDEILYKELEVRNSDPNYVAQQLEGEEIAEEIKRREELDAQNRREEWRKKDLTLHTQWLQNQQRKKKLEAERKFHEESIRKEWEEKVAKESAATKKIKDIEDELLKEATKELGNIEVSCNPDPPPGYVRPPISKAEPCPFFTKTGACRFGFNCSRDHGYPLKSQTILLPNMYSHFGLHGALTDDYDSDICLEYSESDTQHHFKEFFYDVLPEFEKCGKVIQLKVCSNKSAHLKGNVYVQYEKVESAEIAYGMFNGRWYAGRQISCIFVTIEHWKPAICGLYFANKCPKGDSCNFLHVYQNPGNAFYAADRDWFHDKQYEGTPRSERWRSGSHLNERSGQRTKTYSRNRSRLPEGERISARRSFSRESRNSKKSKTIDRNSRSRSKENRNSRSRSKENRNSRSRSKETRKSITGSKDKRKYRSRSKENIKSKKIKTNNRNSRSRSKENRNTRSRSKENGTSRSRSKENRNSRSRSKDNRNSRSRSKETRSSKSRSNENRKSSSKSKEDRSSRSRSKECRNSKSRSNENRKSRIKSKENRTFRSRSKETRNSKSRSNEHRKSRSKSKENRNSRSRFKVNKKSKKISKTNNRKSRSRSTENRNSRSRSTDRYSRSNSK